MASATGCLQSCSSPSSFELWEIAVGTNNYNHRRVKIHRTYTVEEIATLLVVHKNTVRRWLGAGLATIDRQRPLLVKGCVLVAFLKDSRAKKKCKCMPGQLYCLRCGVPTRPAGCRVAYRPFTFDRGTLIGTCPNCEARLCRRVSLAKMTGAIGDLDVAFPQAQEHIGDNPYISLDDDLDRDGLTCV